MAMDKTTFNSNKPSNHRRMMKIILYLFLFFSFHLQAQNNVDSLCKSRYDELNKSSTSGFKRLNKLSYEFDLTKSLNRNYIDKNGTSLHGWYSFNLISRLITDNSQKGLMGTSPNYSAALLENFRKADKIIVSVQGSFDQGVPCCSWYSKIKWDEYDEFLGEDNKSIWKNTSILKIENFKDGLLDGKYAVLNDAEKYIYNTDFVNGTGYYKDYYPTGYDDVLVEGALIKGEKVGTWIYNVGKINNESGILEICDIYVEKYSKGELITEYRFYNSKEVDQKIKKAVEWERQPAKLRKGKVNPFLE